MCSTITSQQESPSFDLLEEGANRTNAYKNLYRQKDLSVYVVSKLPFFSAFHGLEEWMLLRALQSLQADGKAEVITMGDGKGVKFF